MLCIYTYITDSINLEYPKWISICFISAGLLSAPNHLQSDSFPNLPTLILRWNPPFTLDLTHVDPDIVGYTVYYKNLDTGMTEAVDVNETEFSFTGLPGEVTDPCHVYEFRVSAWNVVGESDSSTVLRTSFRGG